MTLCVFSFFCFRFHLKSYTKYIIIIVLQNLNITQKLFYGHVCLCLPLSESLHFFSAFLITRTISKLEIKDIYYLSSLILTQKKICVSCDFFVKINKTTKESSLLNVSC